MTCKAGVFALSKAIAVEFGEFGITANTVAPGIIDTTRDLTQYPHFRNGYGDRIQEIPVRRIGRVDEIAAALSELNIDIICANSPRAKGRGSARSPRCRTVW